MVIFLNGQLICGIRSGESTMSIYENGVTDFISVANISDFAFWNQYIA